jgi:hypothetical protein
LFARLSEVTVALSGTLDTFALPDVLRLLASTAKTGRLHITGDRGSGSVWVADGELVATELASAVTQDPTNEEVVFGLLRFGTGSFTFDADAESPDAGEPGAMEPVLAAAEKMLVEWGEIEKVIPSLDLWVGLCPMLDGPDVVVDQRRWSAIAAIGSGMQVGAVAEAMMLSELDSCRLMKELLELGLVEFADESAGVTAPMRFEPEPVEQDAVDGADPHVFEDATPGEPEALLHELDALDDGPVFATDEDDGLEDDLDETRPDVEPSLAALSSTEEADEPLLSSGDPIDDLSTPDDGGGTEEIFAGAPALADADEKLDPAEMARQLANLSPKAAKAVAAAARATTDAERDAALAAVEAEDDTVNRGLLLKFLGSVDS